MADRIFVWEFDGQKAILGSVNPAESVRKLCPIIVALDVDTRADAMRWVERLGGQVDVFKVGLQLFLREGFGVVEGIIAQGKRVFIDLKLHDIPNTVQNAARALLRPGVEFITVHAGGGGEMMVAAMEAAKEARAHDVRITARVLAVTVLTSLDEDDLRELGVSHSVSGQVMNLARLAVASGVDGLVTSPHEVRLLRAEHRDQVVLVTPGIRPAGAEKQDQKRVMSPAQAVQEGSDFLVMGRSLLEAPDPPAAVQATLQQLGWSR